MTGKIEIKYPIIKKLGVAYYKVYRKVGFHFTNKAIWLLCHNNNMDITDFDEKFKDNRNLFFSEFIYAAYCSYCVSKNAKRKFSKDQILRGFTELKDEQKESILKTWNMSENFGIKDMPKKKAANL